MGFCMNIHPVRRIIKKGKIRLYWLEQKIETIQFYIGWKKQTIIFLSLYLVSNAVV